VGWI
jgi:hypothetical protein